MNMNQPEIFYRRSIYDASMMDRFNFMQYSS